MIAPGVGRWEGRQEVDVDIRSALDLLEGSSGGGLHIGRCFEGVERVRLVVVAGRSMYECLPSRLLVSTKRVA